MAADVEDKNAIRFDVQKAFVYPHAQVFGKNDIAVLLLNRLVDNGVTNKMHFIKIANFTTITNDAQADIYGYGKYNVMLNLLIWYNNLTVRIIDKNFSEPYCLLKYFFYKIFDKKYWTIFLDL